MYIQEGRVCWSLGQLGLKGVCRLMEKGNRGEVIRGYGGYGGTEPYQCRHRLTN